jgi:hypothetical protein
MQPTEAGMDADQQPELADLEDHPVWRRLHDTAQALAE